MVDTVRTLSALQTLLADNTSGDISPQDVRDMLVSVYPKWNSWSPTWTAVSTNPAIGNGTLTGRYVQVGTGSGSFVVANIEVVAGSTTTFGTGEYLFDLPIDAESDNFIGPALGWEAGVLKYEGIAWLLDTSTLQVTSADNASDWGSGVPFAWGDGDMLRVTLTYEAGA